MKIKLLIIILFCSLFSWGQATLPVSRTTWDTTPTGWTDTGTANRLTTFACSGSNAETFNTTNDRIVLWYTGVSTQLTFKLKNATMSGVSFLLVEQSIDNVTYTTLGSYGTAPGSIAISDCLDINLPLNSSTQYIRWTYTKDIGNCDIDDVNVTSSVTSPNLTVTPATLSGFTYVVGSGPSLQQSFNVSGTNLTANVVITAPAGYSISTTSGSGYTNSISLPFGSGTLATTPIYVILNSGLSVNSYTGNITATSTGATTKNVALTGSVTGSQNSDIVAVSSSEALTISSTINNAAPLTSSTGIQVWQIRVRDGGATLNDTDNLPTILTDFTILQAVGDAIANWTDAINTIALFDGATFIASGTVNPTSIVFSGINISVADNTQKTLSLRLSLKCPLGSTAIDGDDFRFTISNSNATFSASGSGKAAFAAAQSTNGLNAISIVATQLAFQLQPTNTGVNSNMSTVSVKAIDACGNLDIDYSSTISITSTGTLSSSPVVSNAVSGVAVFTNILHTIIGSGFTLNASSSGLTSITSYLFDIIDVTIFKSGELIFVAYDGQVNGSGANDEYIVATLVDIKPGTQFSIVNSRYEAGAAANVRTNKWGGGGDFPDEPPYTVLITYNGLTNIPAGSLLAITTNNSGSWFGQVDVISGTTTTNRTSEFSGSLVFGGTYNPNISTSGSDQMFLVQGSFVFDGILDATEANYYLSGTLLHGLTNRAAWVPLTSACSNSTAGGNTRESRLPVELNCFNVESISVSAISGFYQNSKEHGLATKRQIINAVANVPSNWTLGSGRYTKDPTSSLITRAAKTFLVSAGNPSGQWIGDVSGDNTNWFNCGNWEGLKVPDNTTDVLINTTSISNAVIDYTANFSDYYSDIAVCKNLNLSNRTLQIQANINNRLDVYGNLDISSAGILDMDDSNPSSQDGQIYLYGNWTNTAGNNSFQEGNSTVKFYGASPQIINNVAPLGTESFYNVVLNNNFDTAISNDLVAEGNLDVNASKNVSIDSNGYIRVNKALNHNGNLTIENNGQLIQVDETDANIGTYSGSTFQVKRTASVRNLDYVYWSSPIDNFAVSLLPSSHRFEWNTIIANTNGTQGNWVSPSTAFMTQAKGYIARASNGSATNVPLNIIFQGGKPHNGTLTTSIQRGTYTGIDYDAEITNPNNVLTTKWDDNWNLVGNPYPSSINALAFLTANTNIEGFVNVWTHQTLPSSLTDPFYQNFGYNYTSNDYISHNGTGTVSGPGGFGGDIASGQGFFVLMSDGAASSSSVTFTNAMRSDVVNKLNYNNTQFYRSSNSTVATTETIEKNRIWLDVVSTDGNASRTLIGYVSNATNEKDRLYDAVTQYSNQLKIYSYLNESDDQEFLIQGRSLPFDVNDTVKIGVSVPSNGNYSIAIAAVDGLFTANQDIYIQDNLLNTIHNIKQAPYSFSSTAGNFTDRFVLRYTDATLSNDEFQAINSSVIVVGQNNQVIVKTSNENISSVEIYDVLGRLIVTKNGNSNEIVINNVTINNQALIVKTKLENGQVVTKKIIL